MSFLRRINFYFEHTPHTTLIFLLKSLNNKAINHRESIIKTTYTYVRTIETILTQTRKIFLICIFLFLPFLIILFFIFFGKNGYERLQI